MKIITFHARAMRIIFFTKLHKRESQKKMRLLELHLNNENHENIKITYENHENLENHRIPRENFENNKNLRIPLDNHENQ